MTQPTPDDEPPTVWRPLVAFDTDSKEFVRGFELGQLWELLRQRLPVSKPFHAENAEMIIRIAEYFGVTFTATDVGNNWLSVKMWWP